MRQSQILVPYFSVTSTDILMASDLSNTEKLLLAWLSALTQVGGGACTASNAYLARVMGLSKDYVREKIRSLATKKYLDINIVRNADTNEVIRREIYLNLSTNKHRFNKSTRAKTVSTEYVSPSGQILPEVGGKLPQYPSGDICPAELNINNININNIPPVRNNCARAREQSPNLNIAPQTEAWKFAQQDNSPVDPSSLFPIDWSSPMFKKLRNLKRYESAVRQYVFSKCRDKKFTTATIAKLLIKFHKNNARMRNLQDDIMAANPSPAEMTVILSALKALRGQRAPNMAELMGDLKKLKLPKIPEKTQGK